MTSPGGRPLRVATRNPGKLREFVEILAPLGYDVRGVDDLSAFQVEEDGDTFAANALKKAETLMRLTGEPAVADDSGLVVDALGGAPGIHSARYAGVAPPDHDAANRAKLVAALAAVPAAARTARFVCAIAYCAPGCRPVTCNGALEGQINTEERGGQGFGYDPLFVPVGETRTLAEISSDEKHRISHRGQALRALALRLAE